MHELLDWIRKQPNVPWIYLSTDQRRSFLSLVSSKPTFVAFRLLKDELIEDECDSALSWILHANHGYSFDEARKIMAILPHLDIHKQYQSERLTILQELKVKLIAEGHINVVDRTFLNDQTIGCGYDPLYPKRLDEYSLHFIEPELTHLNPITVDTCVDAKEQVHAVIQAIDALLQEGKDIRSIKIINATATDDWALKKEARFYGFTIQTENRRPLDAYPDVVNLLKEASQSTLMDAYIKWKPYNPELISAVQPLLMDYPHEAHVDWEFIRDWFHHHTITDSFLENTVEVIPLEQWVPSKDEHALVMNYSEPGFISYRQNTDYLTDDEKNECGLRSSETENTLLRKKLRSLLFSNAPIHLFHPQIVDAKPTQIPDLIENEYLSVNRWKLSCSSPLYGKDFWRLQTAKWRYTAKKKLPLPDGVEPYLHQLASTPYNPQTKPLSKSMTSRLLKKGFTFSATNLESFNACHFRFLLDYLLKLSPKETTLPLIIGNVTHAILSKWDEESFDFEILSQQALVPYEPLSNADSLQMKLYLDRIRTVIDNLREFSQSTRFTTLGRELPVTVCLHDSYKMTGTIDWLLGYETIDKSFPVVIDYKTGNKDFDRYLFSKGIDIQPIYYLNLLHKWQTNPQEPFGFFYQPLTLPILKKDLKNLSIKNALKLRGICVNSPSLYEALTPNNDISGIKMTSSGSLSSKSRLITDEEMKQLISSIDTLIETAINHLEQGDFSISPVMGKRRYDDSPSCQYCPYHGICYSANTVTETGQESEMTDDDD
jgi:hypothetical protein